MTASDYGTMAATVPGVAEAKGTMRWTGSWYTAFVSVEPTTGQGGALTSTLTQAVTTSLNEKRMMGVATAGGEYAEICSSEWISRLRIVLAAHLGKFGLDDLDASALQMTAPRGLTQLASRAV